MNRIINEKKLVLLNRIVATKKLFIKIDYYTNYLKDLIHCA